MMKKSIHRMAIEQFLLDQFTKQFIKPKNNLIIDILNQYNAICYLEVYLFCVKDLLHPFLSLRPLWNLY